MEMKSAALMKVLVFGVFFIAGHTLFWRGKDNDPLLYFRINTELCHPLQWSGKLFLQTATNRLHFLGCLKEPQPKIDPSADRLADFAACQRDERGSSQPPSASAGVPAGGQPARPFCDISAGAAPLRAAGALL